MFGTRYGYARLRHAGSRRLRAALLATTALAAVGSPAAAQDATWLATPGSANFYDAANWSSGSVPTGTATFGSSATTALTLGTGGIGSIGGWTFSAGASAYTFDIRRYMEFTGAGIVINGGSASITNNHTLYFYNSSTAGNANITNNNILYFADSSTAGSASITNTSIVVFDESSTAGSATITNNNRIEINGSATLGSATIINNRDILFYSNSTAGSASITNNNTLNFYSSSTAGSATITNNYSLAVSDSATLGSATITNNFIVALYNNATAGNATLVNNAGATVDLSNSTGPNSDGKLSAGSIAGAGNYILGANELTVGSNNLSTEVSGVISGAGGSLVKTGSGNTILSGINTYSGQTIVDGGTLSVNGSIAASSLTTVNTGGTLGGNGTVGNTTINGGTLAPGNSIGLLTVQGNLALTSAATYLVEVSPVNADRVNVTGTATLGGATVNANFATGSYVAKQYTILNAQGGVSGTFSGPVNTNLPSGFKSALSYDANNVYLDLSLAFGVPGSLSGNAGAVGDALTGFFNRTGGIPAVYASLDAKGLSQASGETTTGGQQATFNAMTQFMGMMSDPFGAGRGSEAPGAMSYADARKPQDAFAMLTKAPLAQSYDPRWSVWASGFGGSQTTDGNGTAGSNTSTSRIFGVAAGADYRFSPDTIAGFAMAGGGTNFSVTGGGSGRSDLFQIGGFARHAIGATYLSGALAYGWQDITTNRTVIADQLQANFNANTFSGRFEAGHRVVTSWLGGLGLTPYAAAQVTAIALPAYTETALSGSNAFALSYAGKTVTDTRSELGLRSDKSFAVKDTILTLRGRAAWAHDFNTDRAASATFIALPGASFVVNGAAAARDAALTTASAEMAFSSGISLAATFEGEFSQVTRSYAGKGVARYSW